MSYNRHRLFLWALLCRMGSGGAHQPLKSPAAVSWSATIRGLQPKKWHFRGKFDPQNSDIMGIYMGIYTTNGPPRPFLLSRHVRNTFLVVLEQL